MPINFVNNNEIDSLNKILILIFAKRDCYFSVLFMLLVVSIMGIPIAVTSSEPTQFGPTCALR